MQVNYTKIAEDLKKSNKKIINPKYENKYESLIMDFKKTHDMKEMGFSKKETIDCIIETITSMGMTLQLIDEITNNIEKYKFTKETLLSYVKVIDFMYYRFLTKICDKIVKKYTNFINTKDTYMGYCIRKIYIDPILKSVLSIYAIGKEVAKLYRYVHVSKKDLKYIVKYSIPVKILFLDNTVTEMIKIPTLTCLHANLSKIPNLGGNTVDVLTASPEMKDLSKYKIKYLSLVSNIPYNKDACEILYIINKNALHMRNKVYYTPIYYIDLSEPIICIIKYRISNKLNFDTYKVESKLIYTINAYSSIEEYMDEFECYETYISRII